MPIFNPILVGGGAKLETVDGTISVNEYAGAKPMVYFIDSAGAQQTVEYNIGADYSIQPLKNSLVIVDGKGFRATVNVSGSISQISALGGGVLTGYVAFFANGAFTVTVT